MPARGGAAGAFQYELPAHEFPVILADRSLLWREAGIGKIGRAGPLPYVAKGSAAGRRGYGAELVELVPEVRVGRGEGVLPFMFGG